MRVNAVFTRFSNLPRLGVLLLMLAISVIASSYTERPDRDVRAKKVNLLIRQIGHQLLLQAGDSTSRVLPVTEIKEGTFLLKFENELVFNHDSLMVLSKERLPKTEFPSGYILTVHDCTNGSIVYGLQVNKTSPDILACRGRSQPAGCYTIEFAFPDFYEKVKEKKPKPKAPVAASPKEAKAKLVELKSFDEAAASAGVDVREVDSTPGETETPAPGYSSLNVVFGGVILLLVATLLISRSGKTTQTAAVPIQHHAVEATPVPELPQLGKFSFDIKGQSLHLENEIISLTHKECRVLELLHQNFGDLIARETLMQEVWINEGVITGRSLDMFVSKLRKKLSGDPDLRITNIHGKGYRLERV